MVTHAWDGGQDSLFGVLWGPADLPEPLRSATTVDPVSGCWRCSLPHDQDGYARVGKEGAHRVAYRHMVGPIPGGMVIDHVAARGCRFRDCLSPWHLEAVTNRVNILRGTSFAARNAAKQACDHGHRFSEANTYSYRGRRCCRACNAAAVGRYKRRQRAGLTRADLGRAALWAATDYGTAFCGSSAGTLRGMSSSWPRCLTSR
jgi:hypothetical protein